MNKIRAVTYTLLRTYRTGRGEDGQAGIRGKIKSSKMTDQVLNDLEDMDPDDLDEYESDFLNVGESYVGYKREEALAKDRLKQKIVERKYFKNVEPKFLSFIEKTEIQRLHKEDPEEWTVERLSESFPALPDTIRKVLKNVWTPKSVERVLNHDKSVMKNWEDLRSDKLAVSPALREHLMKFKHRKVRLMDEETIEKLLPKKYELPKPRSNFFRRIVEHTGENDNIPDAKLISSTHDAERLKKTVSPAARKDDVKLHPVHRPVQKKKSVPEELMNFREFVKGKLEEIYQKSPEEGIVLLDLYRRQLEAEERKREEAEALENAAAEERRTAEMEALENSAAQERREAEMEALESSAAQERRKAEMEALVNSAVQERREAEMEALENSAAQERREAEFEALENSAIEEQRKAEIEALENFAAEERRVAEMEALENFAAEERRVAEMEALENFAAEERRVAEIEALENSAIEEQRKAKVETLENSAATEANINVVPSKDSLYAIAITTDKSEDSKAVSKKSVEKDILDTYVKECSEKSDSETNYALRVKIPKNIYKQGMTYRINDCYYDHDGEFLYRTPGLKG